MAKSPFLNRPRTDDDYRRRRLALLYQGIASGRLFDEGGVPAETFERITESGDTRVTESGDTRVTEE